MKYITKGMYIHRGKGINYWPELAGLFKEIADFRRTGILKGEALRNLAREFSDNVSHTDYGQNMRLVEDEVLFEMSRRYYNSLIF